MKYIVVHIPSGLYCISKGNNKLGDLCCHFSRLGLLRPLKESDKDRFRETCQKQYIMTNEQKYLKYLSYTDSQIEEMFVRVPKKFKSVEEIEKLLLNTDRFQGLQTELGNTKGVRHLTKEELVLFDIMEVEDD